MLNDEPDVSELLRLVTNTYRRLNSYQDIGILKKRFYPDTKREWISEFTFRTSYKSSGYFRLEWSKVAQPASEIYFVDKTNNKVTLCSASENKVWNSGSPDSNLTKALLSVEARLLAVPYLLLQGEQSRITSLTGATKIGSNEFLGEMCQEVVGNYSPLTKATLFVSTSNHLLRGIRLFSTGSEQYFESLERERFKSIASFAKWFSLHKYADSKSSTGAEVESNSLPFSSETIISYKSVSFNSVCPMC